MIFAFTRNGRLDAILSRFVELRPISESERARERSKLSYQERSDIKEEIKRKRREKEMRDEKCTKRARWYLIVVFLGIAIYGLLKKNGIIKKNAWSMLLNCNRQNLIGQFDTVQGTSTSPMNSVRFC